MDQYLNNYISSSSSGQPTAIADLLNEVKLSKDQLPTIIKGIQDFVQDAPIALTYTTQNGDVDFTPIDQSIRDVRQVLMDLYTMSNFVSQVLENVTMLLHSEVASLEDDLIAMGKSIDNYGFLAGGSNAFNFSYLETFSDDTGRDAMDTCPDRASLTFGPSQKAYVDQQEGMLVLPRDQVVSYNLTYSVLKTNSVNQTASDAPPVQDASQSWRSVVEAAAPITNFIPEASGNTGAQALLEYRLSAAAPVSEISVDPYSDTPVYLLQATTFQSSDDTTGQNLLTQPIYLDQTKTFHFPMHSVQRVRLVINQPTYDRVSNSATSEDAYRAAYDALQARLNALKDKLSYDSLGGFNHMLFLVLVFLQLRGRKMAIPQTMPSQYVGEAGIPALVDAIKRASRPTKSLFNSPTSRSGNTSNPYDSFDLTQFVQSMFQKKNDLYNILAQREVAKSEDLTNSKGPYDPQGILSPLQVVYQDSWVYRYSLGIQNVSIGVGSTGFSGFHVTKPLDSPGDIGEISINVSDNNYRDPSGLLDDSLMTSIEYSVSNVSTPANDSDWIPILPVGVTSIESERLFPDETGRCVLRFLAQPSSTINVYRNNTSITLPLNAAEYDSLNQSIIAMRLPKSAYSAQDILTVSYSPALDYTNISFANHGFDIPPLTNAYDNTGSGEFFSMTSGSNEVTLQNSPYIDSAKASSSAYNPAFGMTDYQPITVRLSGGDVALNLTNYNSTLQPTMPDTGYYFIQSGNSLLFNQPITTGFRVYYQYLQNNVRVRTVLRCDSKQFVSPKVDSLQIKGKTRRANSKGLL